MDGSDERLVADLGLMEPTDGTFDVSADGSFGCVQFAPGRHELFAGGATATVVYLGDP